MSIEGILLRNGIICEAIIGDEDKLKEMMLSVQPNFEYLGGASRYVRRGFNPFVDTRKKAIKLVMKRMRKENADLATFEGYYCKSMHNPFSTTYRIFVNFYKYKHEKQNTRKTGVGEK